MRIRVAAVVLAAAAGCGSVPASAAASVHAPAVPVLTGVALRDATVMQSSAWDGIHRLWIFAQLSSGRPASSGDLTLTRVTAAGRQAGWMRLRGFGHGLSIAAEPCGGTTCVWTETSARAEPARGWALAGAYGTQVARFGWRSGATITPAMVERFGVNGGAAEQTPSVDVRDGLIAVQYWSAGLRAFRWAVYNLAAFKRHRYAALARFTVPRQLAGDVEQGWTLASRHTVANWQGTNTGRPGNAALAAITTTGTLASRTPVTVPGEPEGAAMAGLGNLCTGYATGPPGARRANVRCMMRP